MNDSLCVVLTRDAGPLSAFAFDGIPELRASPAGPGSETKNAGHPDHHMPTCIMRPTPYHDSLAGPNLRDCSTDALMAKLRPGPGLRGGTAPPQPNSVLRKASVADIAGQKACVLEFDAGRSHAEYAAFHTLMTDTSIRTSTVHQDIVAQVRTMQERERMLASQSGQLQAQIGALVAQNAKISADIELLRAQEESLRQQIANIAARAAVVRREYSAHVNRGMTARNASYGVTAQLQQVERSNTRLTGRVQSAEQRSARALASLQTTQNAVNAAQAQLNALLQQESAANRELDAAKAAQAQRAIQQKAAAAERAKRALANQKFGYVQAGYPGRMVLHMPWAYTDDGQPVIVSTIGATQSGNDQVALDPNTGFLIFRHSLKCITASGQDAPVTQNTCQPNNPSQVWRLSGTGQLRPASSPGTCLAVQGGVGSGRDSKVITAPCVNLTGNLASQFILPQRTRLVTIRHPHTNTALGVDSGSANIVLRSVNTAAPPDTHMWWVHYLGGDLVTMVNQGSGRMLSVNINSSSLVAAIPVLAANGSEIRAQGNDIWVVGRNGTLQNRLHRTVLDGNGSSAYVLAANGGPFQQWTLNDVNE